MRKKPEVTICSLSFLILYVYAKIETIVVGEMCEICIFPLVADLQQEGNNGALVCNLFF